MRMKSLLLLLTLLPQPVDASCMRAEIMPQLFTRRDQHLPVDGGVLVGFKYTTESTEYEATASNDPSDVTWTASDHKKLVTMTRIALAPGLSVYRPPTTATAFTLTNKKGTRVGAFTHDVTGTPVAIAAPKPKVVKVESEHDFRSSKTSATLELAAAPPAEAVAIIVYSVGPTSNTAVSFAGLPDTHDKLTSFDIYSSGGHCSNDVPGSGYIAVGSKLVFAYVDTFGRLSPTSTAITAK
jgi:hypothetical protein